MAASTSPVLPGIKHNVIALVSGGKDSCFNMMHTVANGHEIVALATLTPAPGIDELDSHMYQSVGTTLPPLIAQAMGLPHYSHVITGGAVEKGAEYGSRERGGEGSEVQGDETEDLTVLLKKVMAAHPEATAISSGAILSNYQRLRIEHICQRLKLTSLAYLWQSEQLPLVTRMVSSGLEAILVKVAGVGLGVKCVGKSLGQLLPLLTRLQAQYGAHPAGEGGEYETLTLNSPLFSHRINIKSSEVIITDPEPYPVAYLRIDDAELEPKEEWTKPTVDELRELLGLDDEEETEWKSVDESGREQFADLSGVQVDSTADTVVGGVASAAPGEVRFGRSGRWFAVSAEGSSSDSVGAELSNCFDTIKARLSTEGLSLPLHATHITLLLSSMPLFAETNAAYIKYFGTSPPSRACVAVPLPPGQNIRIEVIGFDDRSPTPGGELVGGRSALHVQGISYWAPANIGPYSQAVMVDGRLHIAGQIPLQPASLTLAPFPSPPASPYPHQVVLALQHVSKIVEVLRNPNSTGGGWTGWAESCVAWWARPEGCGAEGPSVVQRGWLNWTRENEWNGVPIILARATELPRGALVEFQVNMHSGRQGYAAKEPVRSGANEVDDDDDDEVNENSLTGVYTDGEAGGVYWQKSAAPKTRHGWRAAVFLSDAQSAPALTTSPDVSPLLSRATTVRVYHVAGASIAPIVDALSHNAAVCWTGVPVLEVRDAKLRSYPIALEVVGV